MNKTLILGSGYLSNNLKKKIKNSEIYSAKQLYENLKYINNGTKYNLIINSFYSSKQLNNLTNYENFIIKSFLEVSKVLDKLNYKKINKVIYTSSSSVYGSIIDNSEQKDNLNRNLYSYTKLCCENLIKNFCDKNNLNYIITRVFNCYGKNNKFSIINKILTVINNNNYLEVYNGGNSIRDFIHVDDVAKIYNILIRDFKKGVFDIGTGKGIKISDLLNTLNFPKKKIKFKKNFNQEVDFSVANLSTFQEKLKNFKFKKVEDFFDNYSKKRIIKKYISNNVNQLTPYENNVVVYGAGYAGKKIAKKIIQNKNQNLLYFIDDDPKKIGKFLFKKKIISLDQLLKVKNQIRINKILIAIPSLDQSETLKIYEKIYTITENISSLPNKEYFRNKAINLTDLIEINVEEILNRKIFQINFKNLNRYKNKTVLITGGAGSIGSEICKQLLILNPKKIIIIDQSEYNIYLLNQKINNKKIHTYLLDINNTKILRNIILKNKVNFIFHAAAYKHVNLLENNQIVGIKNNLIGTLSVLKSIKKLKINFTLISTDKAVYPKNILGITKRASELVALNCALKKNFIKSKINIVRFGNVFGSQGSAIETFVNQIKNQKDLTLTSYNMKRYFMSIREACNLVLQSAILDYQNKIFVLEMGNQIKIFSLIKKILKFYGKSEKEYKIKIIGRNSGEKSSEKLAYSKKMTKTQINNLLVSNENIKKIKNMEKEIKNIENCIQENNTVKAISVVKKIIRN